MHKHVVKTCKHELQVCAECGNVYCLKCNKEWFKEQYTTTPWYVYGTNTVYPTFTVSGTNITDGDAVNVTQTGHTHIQ